MKRFLIIPAILAACAQPEAIIEYDVPYLGGKGETAQPEVEPASDRLECENKPGTFYTPGHEILCQSDEPEEPESYTPPSVECTMWRPNTRVAISEKQCAVLA